MEEIKQEDYERGEEDMWLLESAEMDFEDTKCKIEHFKQEGQNVGTKLSKVESMEDDSPESKEEDDELLILRNDYEPDSIDVVESDEDGEKGKEKVVKLIRKKTHANSKSNVDSLTWKEAIRCAKVSQKVENLCRYRCPTCEKTFNARNYFNFHLIKKCFDTSHTKRRESLDIYLTHAVMHNCKVCSKRLLCDKVMIRNHVNGHKIKSLQDYIQLTDAQLKAHREKINETQDIVRSSRIDSQSEFVGNLCLYKCKKCDQTFECKENLKYHFRKTKHKVSSKINLDSCRIRTTFHRCRKCLNLILCEAETFRRHLRNSHNIGSIDKYRELFGIPVQKATEKVVAQRKEKYSDNTWKDAIRHATNSDKVENLCKYECPTCDKVFMSRSHLADHLRRSRHAPANNERKNLKCLNIYLTHAVMHECKICHKKILCDKHIIKMHIRINHKIYFLDDYGKMTSAQQKIHQDSFEATKNMIKSVKYHYKSEDVGNLCQYQCKKCDLIFKNKLSKYSKIDIYNCNETAFYYRSLPTKSFIEKGNFKGVKIKKDRHTLLI